MYYIVYVIYYNESVQKGLKKGNIPKGTFELFHHAFQALELTMDLNLFDIKKLNGDFKRDYFRLWKDKFRAIFYIARKKFLHYFHSKTRRGI